MKKILIVIACIVIALSLSVTATAAGKPKPTNTCTVCVHLTDPACEYYIPFTNGQDFFMEINFGSPVDTSAGLDVQVTYSWPTTDISIREQSVFRRIIQLPAGQMLGSFEMNGVVPSTAVIQGQASVLATAKVNGVTICTCTAQFMVE